MICHLFLTGGAYACGLPIFTPHREENGKETKGVQTLLVKRFISPYSNPPTNESDVKQYPALLTDKTFI